MNRRAVLTLPKSAPISFIRERWARHVLRGGGIDRRYYELCVLSELRNRLRAGDVWVVGPHSFPAPPTPGQKSRTLQPGIRPCNNWRHSVFFSIGRAAVIGAELDVKPCALSATAERPTQARKRKPRPPLALIDPAPLTRQSIAAMFARALPEYVIITARNSDELLRTASQALYPALVVINAKSAPVIDPWVHTTLDSMKQHLEEAPVVLLSDRDDVEDVMAVLSHGIRGYINPSVEPEVVFAALKLVHAGGTFIPAHAIRTAATKAHNSSGCTRQQVMTALDLTPRELSVIELPREGKPNKLIAAALQMQESTVKVHVRNIMKKLHVANRTHAASVANRLLSQPGSAVGSLPAPQGPNGGARLLTAHAETPGG